MVPLYRLRRTLGHRFLRAWIGADLLPQRTYWILVGCVLDCYWIPPEMRIVLGRVGDPIGLLLDCCRIPIEVWIVVERVGL